MIRGIKEYFQRVFLPAALTLLLYAILFTKTPDDAHGAVLLAVGFLFYIPGSILVYLFICLWLKHFEKDKPIRRGWINIVFLSIAIISYAMSNDWRHWKICLPFISINLMAIYLLKADGNIPAKENTPHS